MAITPTLNRFLVAGHGAFTFVRMPRMPKELPTRKTHRGRRNPKTAERKTAQWVETGGLEKALMKIQSNTRRCHKFPPFGLVVYYIL